MIGGLPGEEVTQALESGRPGLDSPPRWGTGK